MGTAGRSSATVAPGSPRCVYTASLSLSLSFPSSFSRVSLSLSFSLSLSLSLSLASSHRFSPSRTLGRLGYSRYLRRVRVCANHVRFYVGSVAMRDLDRKFADGTVSRVSIRFALRERFFAIAYRAEEDENGWVSSTMSVHPVYSHRRLCSCSLPTSRVLTRITIIASLFSIVKRIAFSPLSSVH